LACQDVLAEQAWSQMSVDELRAVVAFNESPAGMKWAALRARLRQSRAPPRPPPGGPSGATRSKHLSPIDNLERPALSWRMARGERQAGTS
jgi:hypothetical protein